MLKDTTWRPWGSNPEPLAPEFEAIPLGCCTPISFLCDEVITKGNRGRTDNPFFQI